MNDLDLVDLQDMIKKFLVFEHMHVLSISGAWGVGKTFAWDSEFKKFQKDNESDNWAKNYTYVSLFGINNVQNLKSKIIFSGKTEKTAEGISGFFSKLTSSITAKGDETNIALSGIVGAIGGVASIGKDIYIEESLNNKLICIDDLERSKIDIQDLLGFVSYLRKEKNCKVVLIYNEEKLCSDNNKQIISEFREKIIDQHFIYSPSVNDTISLAYQGETNENPYEQLKDYKNIIIEKCDFLKLNNIRIIQKILCHFKHDIIDAFNANPNEQSLYIYHNIISGLCLYAVEFYSQIMIDAHTQFQIEYFNNLYNEHIYKKKSDFTSEEDKQKEDNRKKHIEYLNEYGISNSQNFNFYDLNILINKLIINGFWTKAQNDNFKGLLNKSLKDYQTHKDQETKEGKALNLLQKPHMQFIEDADTYFNDLYQSIIDIIPFGKFNFLDWGIHLFREASRDNVANELIDKIITAQIRIELYNDFVNDINFNFSDKQLAEKLKKHYDQLKLKISLDEALSQILAGFPSKKCTEIINNSSKSDIKTIVKSQKFIRSDFGNILKILLDKHTKVTLEILSDMLDTEENTPKNLYKHQMKTIFHEEIQLALDKIKGDDKDKNTLLKKFDFLPSFHTTRQLS